jgi:hypothetical protein
MLKTETSGVLMTLGAIYHRLEASSAEVTFGGPSVAPRALRPIRLRPDPARPKPRRVADFPCKKMRRYVVDIVIKQMFATEGEALVQGISVIFVLHPQHT